MNCQSVNMYLFVCVVSVSLTFAFAAERNTACDTPNGERATCIPIDSCKPIKRAITYLNPDAIEFARKSQCGYDDVPLVCCGTTGRVTTPPPPPGETTDIYLHIPESHPDNVDHLFLPDSTLCGLQITQHRNPSAHIAEIDEFPWMVVLKYIKKDKSDGGFQCTGTLISDKYVLTAAQCLNITGLHLVKVRVGEWKFSSDEDCNEGPDATCTVPGDYEIERKIPHIYYNKNTSDNNIALLRLKRRVQYSDFIRAICLPPSGHSSPKAGSLMEASGWETFDNGKTPDFKLKLRRSMVDAEGCARSYPNNKNINVNQGCFTAEDSKSRCAVDTGSPLMRQYIKSDMSDEEQFYQEGIIYNGYSCEKKGQPCLYTRVSKYTEWITNNLEF